MTSYLPQVLPATAYLKFIDIWLIFCLLIPFLVFVVQVFLKVDFDFTTQTKNPKSAKDLKLPASKHYLRKFMLIVIPFATILFVFCYVTVAISHHNNSP
jgi:hypothetical protein